MNKTMDILYATDNRYLDITLASILSLLENANLKNICLHIITENFSVDDYKKMENFLSNYANVNFYFYPIEDTNINKYNIPNWRGCQVPNARLFFQEILDQKLSSIDNLFYLDSDTIVVSDLNDLSRYKDNTICACKDRARNKNIEGLNLAQYYNSGIMYFNVLKWTHENCQDKIIKEIENSSFEYRFPDQDIINLTFKDSIETLPLSYNLNPDMFLYKHILGRLYFNKFERCIDYKEVKSAIEHPKILHTYGFEGFRPWQNNNVNLFNAIFRKYLYTINPEYELEELEGARKFMGSYEFLFKYYMFLKPFLPEKMVKCLVKVLK